MSAERRGARASSPLRPSWDAARETLGDRTDGTMDLFYGRLVIVKDAPLDSKGWSHLFAAIERRDGKMEYRMFIFELEKTVWRYAYDMPPEYRATGRVEFQSDAGDALAILSTHFGEKNALIAVKDAPHQFDIPGIGLDAKDACSNAKYAMTALGESLEKAGLEKFFKIINHPTEPKQPLLAEGAPPSDKITARKLPL